MKTKTHLYQRPPAAVEALQFEQLVEIYVELGLKPSQAAAAAQADYLAVNRVAFRRRELSRGSRLAFYLDAEAA